MIGVTLYYILFYNEEERNDEDRLWVVRFPPVLARLGFYRNRLFTYVFFILHLVCKVCTFSSARACVTQQNFPNGGVKK